MNLPVFSVNGNRIMSLKGESSYVYEITPPDLDQKEESEINLFFEQLKRKCSKFDSNHFFKFYFINNKIYLNTNIEEVNLPDLQVLKKTLDTTHIKRQITSELSIKDDYFLIGTKYYRLVSVKVPPGSLNSLDFSNLGNYVVHFQKVDKAQSINSLKLKRRLHNSMTFQSIKNIDSINAYEQSEDLLEEVINGNESLFQFEVFFLPEGSSFSELNFNTLNLLASLNDLEGHGYVENGALTYFLTSLFPGVKPSFKRSHQSQGSYLVNTLSLSRDFVMDDGISFDCVSGQNCRFNLFSNAAHNFNALITGASGQGKSMLGNKIVKEAVLNQTSVVILDLGGSFEKLAKYYDGVEFQRSFNPLQFKNTHYLKEFVKSVIREPLSSKEEGRLFEVIKEYDFKDNSFLAFVDYLNSHFDGLKYYFSEIQDFFNDSDTTQNKLTYVNLSNYPEKIKSPLIIYLIEYFKNLEGKKIFLFDECWHLLKDNGDYLSECFRTFRKYQGSAIAISQNIDDFVSSQLGRVIVQNTFFKFFFRQQASNHEFLSDVTQRKISNLYSIRDQYSEFLLEYEGVSKVLRFFPTNLEYELFVSSKDEINQFNEYFDEVGRFFKFKRTMDNFISLKYPQGDRHV